MRFGLWLLAVIMVSLVQEGDTWRQPVNELGEPCPCPFDPINMRGQPIGQYHCPYCGAMVVAGVNHPDYAEMSSV